jgi:limonene-1,2-epoxide hydrolase
MDRRRFVHVAASAPLVVAAGPGGAAATADATGRTPDYLAITRAMITAWRSKDLEGMLGHIDDDIVWHSHVGSPPVLGKAAMREFAAKLTAQMNDIRWRIFDVAQNGNRLFLEGVDDFVTAEGRRVVLPYAGVLSFRGARISEWRDYFDRALFDRLKAGEPLPQYLQALTTREALF